MADKVTVVDADSGPTHRSPFGDSLRWITGGEEMGGAYCLLERTAPPGAASIPHIHSRVIEAFYVLEGEFTFELAGATVTAPAGSYVQASAGVSHAWRVTSGDVARALVLFSPSVPLAFFEAIDAVTNSAQDGRPDGRSLLAINKKYGLD